MDLLDKNIISLDLFYFLVVGLLSLVIGLSQRKLYLRNEEPSHTFGSDRTFTIIGILGFILYIIGDGSLIPFLCGGFTLTVLLVVYYANKVFVRQSHGITSIVIALVTYCLAPLIYTKELWLTFLVVVSILILTEMKDKFIEFTKSMNDEEFSNLAKFLIVAGVILPVLPKNELIEGTGLTPYSIWLATVVISGISYISYLVKKYVFKEGGIIITGILGGIYSSTATCIILAKKAKEDSKRVSEYVSAIFWAITMMYLKILVLLGIFNIDLLKQYWYLFAVMIVVSALTAVLFHKRNDQGENNGESVVVEEDKNPLEFKVSILFAILFVAFTLVTHYALIYFGDSGLKVLSIIVGVTDINPFIINLFQSHHNIDSALLILAAFQAIISNNVVKMFYGIFFSGKTLTKELVKGFGVIVVVNILLIIFAV
jgi:uncharacterized membrane protein (DUF4010 family)